MIGKKSTKPVAVIDIGTNTVLSLVARKSGKGLQVLDEAQQLPRLGQGVDHHRIISSEAIDRLLEALRYHQKRIRTRFGEIDITVTATSAMRDAENREEVIHRIRQETAWDVLLLSGGQEAEAMFQGAMHMLDPAKFYGSTAVTVIDIGGGSTELALGKLSRSDGDVHPDLQKRESLNAGCVRFTEQYFFGKATVMAESEKKARPGFRPTPGLLNAMELLKTRTKEMVNAVDFTADAAVGVAGTITSLAYMLRAGTGPYRPEAINGSVITVGEIRKMIDRISCMPVDHIVEKWPVVMKGRADIFLAGLLILETCLAHLKMEEITVSTGGLRHGILFNVMNTA